MQRLSSHMTGIDHGSVILFSDFGTGGDMWTGSGPRELRQPVIFSEPFLTIPTVKVSLTMWDVDQKANCRLDISSAEIMPTGFIIVFRTWGDTRVARARAEWLAIGALRGEDDWQL